MLSVKTINYTVSKMFKGYDKQFVNELVRLIILYQKEYKLDTQHRLGMFLGHVKQEVQVRRNGKVVLRENMCYSSKRLKQVFKRFRKNPSLAQKYGKTSNHRCNQRMIANIAYAKRLGNGSIRSGDGWKYRGAGILQTTGRARFEKVLEAVEFISNIKLHDKDGVFHTEWADNYTVGILMGMADWRLSRMYKAKSMDGSTRIINKYTDSYKARRLHYKRAIALIQKANNFA